MANEETNKQLRQIKWWVAIGALGFFLIGLSVFMFSAATASMFSAMEGDFGEEALCEEEADFEDKARELLEEGRFDELENLIAARKETHPYDTNIFWFSARLHSVRGEWDAALEDLDQAALLSPSWKEEFIEPMRSEIARRKQS